MGRRLVKQEDVGLAAQRAGEQQAAPLASRKSSGKSKPTAVAVASSSEGAATRRLSRTVVAKTQASSAKRRVPVGARASPAAGARSPARVSSIVVLPQPDGPWTSRRSPGSRRKSPAALEEGPASAWDLRRKIAAKDESFGHPDVFGSHIPETKWESCTVTTLDERIPRYIEKIAKRDPFSGKVVTDGIVTARDSSWLLSWTVNRQPHSKNQPKDQIVVWVYALYSDTPGDYTGKTIEEFTGEEITREWLYHLGVPVEEIDELAATGAKAVPVMMPYVTAFFMPRAAGDRPDVVPELFNSTFEVRTLLDATVQLRDGEPLATSPDHRAGHFMRKHFFDKLEDSEIGELLHELLRRGRVLPGVECAVDGDVGRVGLLRLLVIHAQLHQPVLE